MISQRLEDLVAAFWEEAGKEPCPRDLECAIMAAKPTIAIRSLRRLCPQTVQDWLIERGHTVGLTTPHRWLDGCFYASKGISFIFVEESLSPEYRRIVIAHEFGHFLAHYEAPRRRIERRLGSSLSPILDGERQPAPPEQLAACLAGVTTEPYVHFMDRNADGSYVEPVSEVERTADELALEIVAPWRTVSAMMRTVCTGSGDVGDWQRLLENHFGLPRGWAEHYANRLFRAARGRLSFSQALGL
jgi:hypothetical protein